MIRGPYRKILLRYHHWEKVPYKLGDMLFEYVCDSFDRALTFHGVGVVTRIDRSYVFGQTTNIDLSLYDNERDARHALLKLKTANPIKRGIKKIFSKKKKND